MNGEYEIDGETFRGMPREEQLWIMFKTFNRHREKCDARFCGLDDEICKLKRSKKKQAALSAGSGFTGGFAAMLAKLAFWN